MNGLVDRVASVLERRFLLVAFLPTLIFGAGLTAVAVVAGHHQAAAAAWLARAPAVTLLLMTSAALGVAWLVAGFVDSQLRNLTQLFEGYVLEQRIPKTLERARQWHRERAASTTPLVVVRVPAALTPEATSNDAIDGGAQAQPFTPQNSSGEYAEEAFVLYPEDQDDVLPTRFGNVIRAAEDYAHSRYGADYLLVWPRLAHLCSERFVRDYEEVRASVDFLLVVSSYFAAFAIFGGVIILFEAGPILMFAASVLGSFAAAHLVYKCAVGAAIEYGEQIRASMDLYRLELLRQLRYPDPTTREEEAAHWREFEAALKRGHARTTPYVQPAS